MIYKLLLSNPIHNIFVDEDGLSDITSLDFAVDKKATFMDCYGMEATIDLSKFVGWVEESNPPTFYQSEEPEAGFLYTVMFEGSPFMVVTSENADGIKEIVGSEEVGNVYSEQDVNGVTYNFLNDKVVGVFQRRTAYEQ